MNCTCTTQLTFLLLPYTAVKEKATQVYNPQTTVATTTAAASPSVVTIKTSVTKAASSLPKLSASASAAGASGLTSKTAATETSSSVFLPTSRCASEIALVPDASHLLAKFAACRQAQSPVSPLLEHAS